MVTATIFAAATPALSTGCTGTARRGRAKRKMVAVTIFLGALAACEAGDRCGPSRGVVARVVDGDTVELEDGTKVRYLDVDTPESTSDVECFGEDAAAYNASRVLGREVRLTYESQCEDRFGRLLAHVWVDGRVVGLDLVWEGYGCTLFIEPDTDQRTRFEDAEAEASALGRGLWGACGDPPPC